MTRPFSLLALTALVGGCGAAPAAIDSPIARADQVQALSEAVCSDAFGALTGWNVVTAQELVYSCSDIEGSILAGSHVSLVNMGVALTTLGNGAALVADGFLAVDHASINGDIY